MPGMVSTLTPLTQEGFYTLVIQPYKEGAERINRFFSGIDDLTLDLRPLPWKERVVSLIAGIALMTPLINTIVWLSMQTFGHPDPLTDPFVPEEILRQS